MCGFAVWFGTAYAMYGAITIGTTGKTLPCMYACLTSFFVPLPVTIAISYFYPENFDWDTFLEIDRVQSSHNKKKFNREDYFSPEKVAYMKKMSRTAAWWGAATFFGQVLIWPLPMYGAKTVMGKGLFVAWIVISLIWLWIALIIANFLPLIDGGAAQIWTVFKDVANGRVKFGKSEDKEESGTSTPSEGVVGVQETVVEK